MGHRYVLATNSENRIHVVVAHISTLGSQVLGIKGKGQFLVHCEGCIDKMVGER